MLRKTIPTSQGLLHLRGKKSGTCHVHDWPTDGLAERLVQAAKDMHPKGVDACVECIERGLADARAKRGKQ